MATETEEEYEAGLKFMERRLANAKTALESARLDVAMWERTIESAKANRPGQSPNAVAVVADAEGHQESPYAGMGPQAAVEAFFRQSPPTPYKPSRVARLLRHGGCRASAKPNVFVSQVRTACLRLTEKHILEQTSLDGKTAFQLKKEAENA